MHYTKQELLVHITQAKVYNEMKTLTGDVIM